MRFNRWWVRGLSGAALALLGACGGGGGASGPTLQSPPTVAATLTQSTAEAQAAVAAAVTGGLTVVKQVSGLESSFLVIGSPIGSSGSPMNFASRVMAASRERAQAVQTVTCGALGIFAGPCSGSVTVDTNAPAGVTILPAGTFVSMNFNALSGTDPTSGALTISGNVRIDFLTPFDTNALNFVNTSMQLTSTNLSGSAAGVAFGPENAVALLEIDANGIATFTADGVRIANLDAVTVTDADNFRLIGTVLRSAYWGGASTYVDTSFTNWVVTAGRPQVGSTGTLSAGAGSVAVLVMASSATTVVYAATLSLGATPAHYTVTATYPAGGGAPTYVAVPAP